MMSLHLEAVRGCRRWALDRAIEVAQEKFDATIAGRPSQIIGAVRVFGGNVFVEEVEMAMRLLQDKPFALSLVRRYIKAIVETKAPTAQLGGLLIGVGYLRSTDSGRLPMPANGFAARLVRWAVSVRMYVGFGLSTTRHRELFRNELELDLMKHLNCHPTYIQEQLDEITKLHKRSFLKHKIDKYLNLLRH